MTRPIGIRIRLFNDSKQTYVLQASTDLTHWTAIATNQAASEGTLILTDPQTGEFAGRFYRAFIPAVASSPK